MSCVVSSGARLVPVFRERLKQRRLAPKTMEPLSLLALDFLHGLAETEVRLFIAHSFSADWQKQK